MNRFILATACLSVFALGFLATADEKNKVDLSKIPPAAVDPMDFQRDIQPILAKACLSCHCAGKEKGGLRLDDGAEAIKGSNSGPVYKPGDAITGARDVTHWAENRGTAKAVFVAVDVVKP